jgi:peptide/nickel transport system permease protein
MAEATSAPPAPAATSLASASASPMQLALQRLLRWWSARFALALLALLFLVAVYAPFLVNEVAWVWHDRSGWSMPLISDLFNQWSYPHWYDLMFNLLALELPVLLAMGLLLPSSRATRLLLIAVALVASFVGCCLPVLPQHDGSHAAVWRLRDIHASVGDYHDALDAGGGAAVHAWFAPIAHRFDGTYAGMVLQPPGAFDTQTATHFWLGTDTVGHDVLAQIAFGARISLTIGIVSSGLSLIIGTLIGALSGYAGGWVDIILQRLVEIMLCFPTFLLILCIVAMLGHDIFVIMAVIGLTSWASTARLVRGEFLAQAVRDYVIAGESLGLSRARLMFRHILPNALTPLLITATFGIAGAVLSESGLAFLGMGDPNVPSWGGLLQQGEQAIDYGWLIYVPGLSVFGLVTALNVLGNAIREALDPKGAS